MLLRSAVDPSIASQNIEVLRAKRTPCHCFARLKMLRFTVTEWSVFMGQIVGLYRPHRDFNTLNGTQGKWAQIAVEGIERDNIVECCTFAELVCVRAYLEWGLICTKSIIINVLKGRHRIRGIVDDHSAALQKRNLFVITYCRFNKW